MQRADQLIGFGLVAGQQRAIDVVAQRLGFGRHQIAADPLPDRLERDPRDAADALVVGGAVEQKRLERREKQARRIADARHRLRLGADGAPQFVEHEFVAGIVVAAQQAALELCTSIARASGLRVRRYSRSRSTDCPSLVIAHRLA